jgi:predicted nucleic acid-binding protein
VDVTDVVTECRDKKDDKFLALAISGQADFIVTGDEDLLVLNPFREVVIMSPADFFERINKI